MRCDQRSVTLSTRDWSPLICLSCVNHNNSETKSKLDMQIPCYVFQQLKRNGQIHFMTRPRRQKSPINVFLMAPKNKFHCLQIFSIIYSGTNLSFPKIEFERI